MTPRTEVSVCERETIGKTKCKLLGSEIVTELEVSQFFLGKMENRTWVLWGQRSFCMAWFREVRAQVGGRMVQKLEALKTTPVGMVRKKGGRRPHFFGEECGCTAEMALPRWQKGGLHCGWFGEQTAEGLQSHGP